MIKHFVVVFLMVSALALMFGSGLYYGQGILLADMGIDREDYFSTKARCEDKHGECKVVALGFVPREMVERAQKGAPQQDNSI